MGLWMSIGLICGMIVLLLIVWSKLSLSISIVVLPVAIVRTCTLGISIMRIRMLKILIVHLMVWCILIVHIANMFGKSHKSAANEL